LAVADSILAISIAVKELSQIENADLDRNTNATAEAIMTAPVSEMTQIPRPGIENVGTKPGCPAKLENTLANKAIPTRPNTSRRFARILRTDRIRSFFLLARLRTLDTLKKSSFCIHFPLDKSLVPIFEYLSCLRFKHLATDGLRGEGSPALHEFFGVALVLEAKD
jgi:hypothetical protein